MENTTKVKSYAGGEIHKTVDGYYIFKKGDGHCGPYVSISSLKGAVEPTVDEAVENEDVEAGVEESVAQDDIDNTAADGAEVEPTVDEAVKTGKK